MNWRGVSGVMATSRESVVKVEPPEIDDTCENRMGGGNSLSPTLVNVDSKEVIDFNTDVIKKNLRVSIMLKKRVMPRVT